MRVKIVKCSNPGFWYAGLVGQSFEVEDHQIVDIDKNEKYEVIPTPGTDSLFYINVDDCFSFDEMDPKSIAISIAVKALNTAFESMQKYKVLS